MWRCPEPWWLAVAGSLLLAGCRVGPDYEAPTLQAETDAPWRAADDPALRGPRVELARWWDRFGDPTLSALAERLLRQNLSLTEARQRVVAARAAAGVAGAARLPALALDGSYTRAGTGDESLNFTGPPPGQEVDVYSVGVAASWELDLWGRVGRLEQAAGAEIGAAVDDYRDAAVSLLAQLVLAYVDARTLDGRLAAVHRSVDIQEDTLALAQVRLDAGTGPRLDVEQARRLLERTRARLPELERARTVAENRIAVLLGERPRDDLLGEAPPLELPPTPGLGLPADLLSRRADVRRAERQLAAAVARVGAAQGERYPSLSLSGRIAATTRDSGDLLDGAEALSYSVGPRLHLPLFEGGRIDSTVTLREAGAEQARAALERSLLAAIGEVEDAAVGVARSRERLDQLQVAVDAARHAVELARQLQQAGLRDLLTVLDAQRALVDTEDELLLARQAALGETVQLYRALGGGWETLGLDGSPTTEPAQPPATDPEPPTEEERT